MAYGGEGAPTDRRERAVPRFAAIPRWPGGRLTATRRASTLGSVFIHVVRHAESMANIGKSSEVDCDLSDLGRGQVAAVARELASIGIDRVLTSPYRRALLTATGIARVAGVMCESLPELHEHQPNALPSPWPLMRPCDIGSHFPDVMIADCLADEAWHRAPETDAHVLERMAKVIAAIERRFDGASRVALVTHGSPAGKLVQAFLAVADATRAEIAIANASITTFEIVGAKRYVRAVSRVEHLRDAAPVSAESWVNGVQPALL